MNRISRTDSQHVNKNTVFCPGQPIEKNPEALFAFDCRPGEQMAGNVQSPSVAPITLHSRESSHIVTGPSFTKDTAIMAANIPV